MTVGPIVAVLSSPAQTRAPAAQSPTPVHVGNRLPPTARTEPRRTIESLGFVGEGSAGSMMVQPTIAANAMSAAKNCLRMCSPVVRAGWEGSAQAPPRIRHWPCRPRHRAKRWTSRRLGIRPTRAVSYTHLRAHETPEHLVCRLLLE